MLVQVENIIVVLIYQLITNDNKRTQGVVSVKKDIVLRDRYGARLAGKNA
jgi:hypothetical protein